MLAIHLQFECTLLKDWQHENEFGKKFVPSSTPLMKIQINPLNLLIAHELTVTQLYLLSIKDLVVKNSTQFFKR